MRFLVWTGSGPASAARRLGKCLPSALATGFMLGSAWLLCLAAYDDGRVIARVFNSDALLPTSFIWNVLHGPDPWQFQLPGIPSLVPDLLVYGALDALLGDFRAAIFLYSVFQCVAFAAAAGWVIARAAGTRWLQGMALSLVVIEAVILVDLRSEAIIAHFGLFTPVEHFGAFLMSLAAAALTMSLLESWRRSAAALLMLVCGLAFLSDRIFMFEFVLPLGAALLVLCRFGRADRARAVALLVPTAIGVAAAAGADLFLNREAGPPIGLWSSAMNFLTATPSYLRSVQRSAIVSLSLPYLVFAAYPLMRLLWPAASAGATDRSDRAAMFFWSFAATAIAGSFALEALLYVDQFSYRYLIPALFWPLIFVAVAALRFGGRFAVRFTWCAAMGLAVALAVPAYEGHFEPGSATWRDPLATCLLDQREALGLKDGLAEYWLARPATIGTDWGMQIDQINGDGTPFYWGNNPQSYRRSNRIPAQAPDYNFIVIDTLDPAALLRKFGHPARIAPCGSYTLWIYAELLDPVLLGQTRPRTGPRSE